MHVKAVAAAVFAVVLLAVFSWYEPSRDELAFSDVAQATLEVGEVLPPLPEGAHDLQMFGHQSADSLHLRFGASPEAIETWLEDAEQAESGDVLGNLPHIVDSIVWWHPALRQGGRDGGSYGRVPPIFHAYGHWVAVDGTSVYLW